MRHMLSSLFNTAIKHKTGGRIAAVMAVAFALAACQPQFQTPSDLLFAPTFSKSRESIPNPAGTQYDCRTFEGSGWQGITSGVVIDFDNRINISRAGCFKTKAECEAYVTLMSGYIDQQRFMRCRPHTA
ncbi:MAG: hypothetical protein ABJY83_23885 [Roseibium sp.]